MSKQPKIETVPTADLIPYAMNSRTHSADQVGQIAASIKEFGFTNPVLIDADNGIIAGHGRLLAAQKLKLQEVPCIRLGHLTDAQKRAYVIADNKLALNAGWDEDALKAELNRLQEEDFDIGLTGFSQKEIEKMMEEVEEEEEPEVEFSDDLMLAHNYVVLYFDNDLDWQVAIDKFKLKNVKSCDPAEKCQKVGIGRVVNGKDFI